jgi:glucokinase
MSNLRLVLGIEIGGTTTKLRYVDEQGECLSTTAIPTDADDFENFLSKLVQAARTLSASVGTAFDLLGVGIGAPNANFYTGTVELPPNLNWGPITPLAARVQEHLKVPVKVTNDANAAALGEMHFGAAKGMRDFVVLTLGTGLGSGIVVGGQLVYGHDGFAGEIGHTLVNVNGRICGCGRRGCLETYVSATGICRTVYKLLADYTEPSELRSIPFDELSAVMITDAALRGDFIARQAFECTARVFGMKLADTVATLSPEAIILFGGLTRAREVLIEPTQRYMEQYMMPLFRGKVKLLISPLDGANTAVLGAAALMWNEIHGGAKL